MNVEITLWFLVLVFVVAIFGVWWMFHSRQSKPPSHFERAVATGWLLFRRIVCFAGAFLFLVGAVMLAFNLIASSAPLGTFSRLGYALFMLLVSAFCVWAAIYGQGQRYGAWEDDVALHRQNKKRYGWRW